MIDLFYIVLGLVCLGLLFSFAWRYGTRLTRLPCPAWLAWTVERDNPFTSATRSAAIIRASGLRPGMMVLDVGCGPGRVAIPAAQAVAPGGEVLALDLQPAMLRRAQAKAVAAQVGNIRFLQAGAGEGKLQSGQFDRALLITVLGEIPDRQAALAEIFRSLKPGGVLTVAEVAFDPHYQRHGTVAKLAAGVGFREGEFSGAWYSYSLNLEKPAGV
jgi:ubiquinone/menaquinone biosynthesis C-methylase UbiE